MPFVDTPPGNSIYYERQVAKAERHLSLHFADLQKRDFSREPFTKLTQSVLTLHGMLDRNAPYGSGLELATTFPNGAADYGPQRGPRALGR